jgi:hypothetical protein
MSYFDIIDYGPLQPDWLRPPLWRWLIANEYLANPTRGDYLQQVDPYVREASALMHYLADKRPSLELHLRSNPALLNAQQIYRHMLKHSGARWQVEALLLGGAPDEVMHELFPTPGGPATYRYYRKLFFDIETYRDNPHAVLANVFGLSMARHSQYDDQDLPWKLLGYSLGWEAFSSFMKNHARGHLNDDAKQFFVEYAEARILYSAFTQVVDLQQTMREDVMNLLQVAGRYYVFDDRDTTERLGVAVERSCRALVDVAFEAVESARRRHLEHPALEPVHSGTQRLQLTSEAVAELEGIYGHAGM